MKSFREFITACEGYKPLPKRRMDREAGENAAAAVGNLGVAAIPLGIEGAVGELGDAPETVASRFIDKSSGRINRAATIIKTILTHSPERVQQQERENRNRKQPRSRSVRSSGGKGFG